MSSRQLFIAVLVGATLLHIAIAVSAPMSGDEAYYWDCSRHLDWSYFDQPPLVIWAMVPLRAILGDTRLAVRGPAVLASLLIGMMLLPIARRLGGGHREAAVAFLMLHGMPSFFLGAAYASTDIAMAAAYLGATWAAVALAQGERRAWWGFGVAIGLGFLAKFPVVVVLAALAPAVLVGRVRHDLATSTPYLAGALSLALTSPVWIWGARHDWANIAFQLVARHQGNHLDPRNVLKFVVGILLLATPFLAAAAVVAWSRARRRSDPGWRTLLVAAASPVVVFGIASLLTRSRPHWALPGLMVAFVPLAFERFRGRRTLVAAGMALGLALVLLVVTVVVWTEPVMELRWRWAGRPAETGRDDLADLFGYDEIAAEVAAVRHPGELVASESYSMAHLLAFASEGELPTRLANVVEGRHGLASLYWYRPEELLGRDVLFVTERLDRVREPLALLFEQVVEEPAIEIPVNGRVVRTVSLLRCRNLLRAEGVFTR